MRKASSKERDICSLRELKKVWAVLISWGRNSTHSPLISTKGLFNFTSLSNAALEIVCPPIAKCH